MYLEEARLVSGAQGSPLTTICADGVRGKEAIRVVVLYRRLFVMMFVLLIFPALAVGQRKVAEETIIFKSLRDGVFTVFGDHGQGSGFLIDEAGLVLTNSHVVSSSSRITVRLDDSTRVEATVAADDKIKDVAVLLLAEEFVRNRPVLPMADRPVNELAFEGEKVMAIGSPLHQTRILTSGIVSKVEESAIITDVNINPGNSGGPLINMASEVIAINTFRDPSLGGSGISGSIPINVARDLINTVRGKLSDMSPQPTELLPVTPREQFPAECIRWAQKRCYVSRNYSVSDAGSFSVTILTPPRKAFLISEEEQRLAKKRKKREEAAGVPASQMYDPLAERVQEWRRYVGEYAPVVSFRVVPKIGETSGSTLLNLLGAAAAGAAGTWYYGHSVYEFKADLQDFEVWGKNHMIPDVFRSMDIMPISVSMAGASMDDVAQQGIFAYLPDPFFDFEANDVWLLIKDLKRPGQPLQVQLPRACLEQIWVDFEPCRDAAVARQKQLLVK
jgi:hypothetical protein